ncbi:unnamed protein product, partial [Mesorhabditis belari]|uniref:BTB domain-containing protein n=1 Tax=Mesorhabditis belari TaxID=2138241 RepID=A0AAF3J3R7_9BILA
MEKVESDLGGQFADREEASNSPPPKLYVDTSHTSSFFEQLNSLRSDRLLCDVSLVPVKRVSLDRPETPSNFCKGSPIYAHKVILSSTSPYFCAMFATSNMIESKASTVELHDMDEEALRPLIDFIYTGQLTINSNLSHALLTTASMLQLNSVKDACANFLIDTITLGNVISLLDFACIYNCTQLAVSARNYIYKNFCHLVDSDELLTLDFERFCSLISDDRLVCGECGEEEVYRTAIRWIQAAPEEREQYTPKLLSQVRLGLCSGDFLAETVFNEPVIKNQQECKDILLEASKVHLRRGRLSPSASSLRERFVRPRQQIGSNKIVIVVGGQAPKAIHNVDAYDPTTMQWTSLSPLSQRRCRCGVALIDRHIYAVGGFNGAQRMKSVDVYDTVRNQWIPGPPMRLRRGTLGVTTFNDQLLIAVGGFDGANGIANAELLDPRTGDWSELASMTTRRSSVGVTSVGSSVYAVGGYDGHSRHCLNTVEVFDLRANRWRAGKPLREVRSGAAVCSLNGLIVAAGGHEGATVRDTVEIYNPGVDDDWALIPNMSAPRRNAGVLFVNSSLMVFGGDEGDSHLLDSIETLTMDMGRGQRAEFAGRWQVIESTLPQPRSYSGLVLVDKP